MPAKKIIEQKKTIEKKQTQHSFFLPTLISRVFDPPVVLTVLSIIGMSLSDLSHRGYMTILMLLPVFIGLPLLYLLWSLKTHHVSNWDITNRKERIVPLVVLLGFLAVDIAIVSVFDNEFLINMFLLYFLWNVGFLLITLVWKISGHTGIATLASGVLVRWFGPAFLPVFLIVPLVSWARLVRRDHTLSQVVFGAVYSLGILAFWSSWVY